MTRLLYILAFPIALFATTARATPDPQPGTAQAAPEETETAPKTTRPGDSKAGHDEMVTDGSPAGAELGDNTEAQTAAVGDLPITPPQLLERREPAFPSTLQASGVTEGEAVVIVTVGETGRVDEVTSVQSDHSAFETALRQALKFWRFEPARRGKTPTPSRMQVRWKFKAQPVAAPEEQSPEAPALGVVQGRVFRRGIRKPVMGMVIRFDPGGYEAFTNETGHFVLEAPPARYEAIIEDSAYEPFRTSVEIELERAQTVEFRITPVAINESSVVVVGRRIRENQRVSLDRFELTHVPGTMGDPLRVIQSLPGVGSFASFLPFPIVRGAPPGDTGYFVDEASIPMLFHLGIGTSVIHPQLIDQVNFYPGVAPIKYGRYLGGAVEAKTRVAEDDVWVGDLDINFFQSGALISAPLNEGKTRLTAGGRISYTGLLLSLLSTDIYLNFWDYVLRLDHRFENDHQLSLSSFGAQDEMGQKDDESSRVFIDFHRVVSRYSMPFGRHKIMVGLDLGMERVDTPQDREEEDAVGGGEEGDNPEIEDDEDADEKPAVLREYSIRPMVRWRYDLSERLFFETGADLEIRPANNEEEEENDEFDADDFLAPPTTKYVMGLYHGLAWFVGKWQLSPRVRFDYYENIDRLGIDPRFTARYTATDRLTMKGQLGLSHAQQRFLIPIPGVGDLELDSPLQESWQATVGAEYDFGHGYSLDANIYGAYRRHLISLTDDDKEEIDESDVPPELMEDETFDIPTEDGRAVGFEMILRKKRTSQLFGWLAYTLQRVERKSVSGWVIDPLDQTHIANLVVSWRFSRKYIWGVRLHYNTGRYIASEGRRLNPYFQVDTRFDWLVVADNYQLNIYLDVINAAYQGEQLSLDENPSRYILPTIGAHGTF